MIKKAKTTNKKTTKKKITQKKKKESTGTSKKGGVDSGGAFLDDIISGEKPKKTRKIKGSGKRERGKEESVSEEEFWAEINNEGSFNFARKFLSKSKKYKIVADDYDQRAVMKKFKKGKGSFFYTMRLTCDFLYNLTKDEDYSLYIEYLYCIGYPYNSILNLCVAFDKPPYNDPTAVFPMGEQYSISIDKGKIQEDVSFGEESLYRLVARAPSLIQKIKDLKRIRVNKEHKKLILDYARDMMIVRVEKPFILSGQQVIKERLEPDQLFSPFPNHKYENSLFSIFVNVALNITSQRNFLVVYFEKYDEKGEVQTSRTIRPILAGLRYRQLFLGLGRVIDDYLYRLTYTEGDDVRESIPKI